MEFDFAHKRTARNPIYAPVILPWLFPPIAHLPLFPSLSGRVEPHFSSSGTTLNCAVYHQKVVVPEIKIEKSPPEREVITRNNGVVFPSNADRRDGPGSHVNQRIRQRTRPVNFYIIFVSYMRMCWDYSRMRNGTNGGGDCREISSGLRTRLVIM